MVFGEQMDGKTSSNSTKISTNLFLNGKQTTYDDLLAAMANLHGALSFMINPSNVASSLVLSGLSKLFDLLALEEFEHWFKYHVTGNVTWFCHSILVDVHNYFCQIVLLATSLKNQHAVLCNMPIKALTVLIDAKLAFATIVQKWNMATSQNSLSSYNSEPSTWALVTLLANHGNKKKKGPNEGSPKSGLEPSPLGNGSWGRFNGSPPS